MSETESELLDYIDAQRKKIHRMVKEFREALANYMSSEGCDCCSNRDAHDEHRAILAKMLGVPKYPDGSGYDFDRFLTPKPK